ncbi:MAG: DUF368 domain-containing protein [Xanthomonadales bacterium]|nr:DUF368 domain-containing protein [Gammaproteobacteria bacterium]MBT8055099.1 DUF368 domain-containing protein [Gammaproteobacteria bacterium]NND58412.1 DUF368 domain-containing protein [Xanthomonadales bacterium]NNK51693.1 DUF368 domain-containing protein [Xanthomonadales bacterium]
MGSADIVSGISGSFALLILGKYACIINAYGEFNVFVIVIFGTEALTGLARVTQRRRAGVCHTHDCRFHRGHGDSSTVSPKMIFIVLKCRKVSRNQSYLR